VTVLSEREVVAIALKLGADRVPGWSVAERELCVDLPRVHESLVDYFRRGILSGRDPLGEVFCELRTPAVRRVRGATYTPIRIVSAMVAWAARQTAPARVVDPGVGSARFLLEAGKRFRESTLTGIDIDPFATLLARANVNTLGFTDRAEIHVGDYRDIALPNLEAPTLFIGNPPYVRHHDIAREWKAWLSESAAANGYHASQLAGLHVHFLLATALKAQPGDYGTFITSAEWLDVNYGSLARQLFLDRLGGRSILVIDPAAQPFSDAATTAAIVTFHARSRPASVQLKRIDRLDELNGIVGGRRVRRARLESDKRWSHFTRRPVDKRSDYVELGELCRVHRGQVTGANKVWIAGAHSVGLPDEVLLPAVTRARELIESDRVLADASRLRNVINLPVDLDAFAGDKKRAVEKFLEQARSMGGHTSYVARHRRAWWSVGLREPAPILATYMARRPPAFAYNLAKARHLNIAHGLYPRDPLTEDVIRALVAYLSEHTNVAHGRTYAGGLTKFEPREMERLLVPTPEALSIQSAC